MVIILRHNFFSGVQEPSKGADSGETGAGSTEEAEKQRDQEQQNYPDKVLQICCWNEVNWACF